ncbi:MAG TPA: hypothetical protein VK416_06130 [Thermoanaerobaculia bacterium]|nr:hypothetical protein [Thermoanaerobaculia bacterium]
MRQGRNLLLALAMTGAAGVCSLPAQTTPSPTPAAAEMPASAPAETPTPRAEAAVPPASSPAPAPTITNTPLPSPTPVPTGPPPRRLAETPVISISRLGTDNPFGLATEEPAALAPKLEYPQSIATVALFAAVRVDPTGRVLQSRIVRDPIPSLAADSRRSFEQRWSFDPAVKAGQPVETWASLGLDLQVEVRPREEQTALALITPGTPLPTPFAWGDDKAWFDNFKAVVPTDGTVPLEQVDTTASPKKTKWLADSYKGPFSCRLWVKVSAAGRIEKVVPIQVSDPVLIAYMRKTAPGWVLRPARVKGQPVDSWNELNVSGVVSYSIEIKQINNLRKTFAGQ